MLKDTAAAPAQRAKKKRKVHLCRNFLKHESLGATAAISIHSHGDVHLRPVTMDTECCLAVPLATQTLASQRPWIPMLIITHR